MSKHCTSGYHNFHHEFPYDFRNGIKWYHFDPTKWFVLAMNAVGLAFGLKVFPADTIEQGRLQMLQKKLDERKAGGTL